MQRLAEMHAGISRLEQIFEGGYLKHRIYHDVRGIVLTRGAGGLSGSHSWGCEGPESEQPVVLCPPPAPSVSSPIFDWTSEVNVSPTRLALNALPLPPRLTEPPKMMVIE